MLVCKWCKWKGTREDLRIDKLGQRVCPNCGATKFTSK